MESIFLRVLDMSVSAAVVIAVVILLRLVLRNAPKKWRYLLWSAAGFRLACPVSFRAAFSIFRLRPPAASAASTPAVVGNMTYIARPAVLSPLSSVPGAQAAIPSGVLTAPMATAQASAPVQAAASVDPLQVWLMVGAAVWLAGLAVMLILGAVRYLRMKGKLADAVMLEKGVYVSDAIRVPFILGLLPPRIYVPAGLEGKELRYVLAHERAHLRRCDHWAKLLAYLLLSLHWFNPLVWLGFYLMSRDMEMSCDERVLSDMEGEAKDYSRTLLAFAEGKRFPAPAPLGFGESDVKSRIKNALRWRKPKLWVTVIAVVLCLAAIAACTANPKDKTEESPAPAVDLKASDIHEARLLNASLRKVYGLSAAQRDELIRLLDAVPGDKIVQGRGIPSEKVLELMGAEYSLRFAGGVIELDFDDPAAAAEKYGPAVWEIRDEALYDWLEALWAENAAVLEAVEEPEPRFVIPDIEADSKNDTVFFGFSDDSLALLGVEGKTNQDVIDAVPFDDLSFREEDNFLTPGDPAILSGGTLLPGLSVPDTRLALFGYTYHSNFGEEQMRKPQIILHGDVGPDDYHITGVYAGQLFDLSLIYGSDGEILCDITLAFLPNEGEDHALELYALLRSALTQQLGAPQKEELNGHYDRKETSYDKDGNAVSSSEPVDYVLAAWGDEDATLTLQLEIGQYYSRSLTIRFYENIYYAEETGTPADGLSKMASLRAEDITGILHDGWVQPDAGTLAPLMNAAAAHPTAGPEAQPPLRDLWSMEVYIGANPYGWTSLYEHYELCAQQTEGLLFVRYWDGQHGDGSAEEYWLEDAALYNLVRGCFRSDGVVEAEAWEKYGACLEARAQETVDNYEPYGAGGFTGFRIIRLEKTAHIWRSPEGDYLPVYAWQVAFKPEDVNNVGWVGGMKLDAEDRVVGFELNTFFAVREGPGGPELSFLSWDSFLGGPEAAYDAWKEAYWKLLKEVILPETEYNDGTGPVLDLGLADLNYDGVPELICYLPGGGTSHTAAIVTFEEGEARAFNADRAFGLPLAKNALEYAFAANPETRYPSDGAFRYDPAQMSWFLNSANGTELDRWCAWYRFGADQNGYLAAEQLVSLGLVLEQAEGGYREVSWELNGAAVTSEEYHDAADGYDAWLENLGFDPFDAEQRIKFFSLRERTDDLPNRLAAWLGAEP